MGMDPWIVDGYMELFEGFAEGWASRPSPNVAELLGRPARSYRQFAQDFRSAFASAA
jgi:hypothetical protein